MSPQTVLSRETLAPLGVVAAVAVAAYASAARLADIEHGVEDVRATTARIEARLQEYVTTTQLREWIARAQASGATLPDYR